MRARLTCTNVNWHVPMFYFENTCSSLELRTPYSLNTNEPFRIYLPDHAPRTLTRVIQLTAFHLKFHWSGQSNAHFHAFLQIVWIFESSRSLRLPRRTNAKVCCDLKGFKGENVYEYG